MRLEEQERRRGGARQAVGKLASCLLEEVDAIGVDAQVASIEQKLTVFVPLRSQSLIDLTVLDDAIPAVPLAQNTHRFLR